jgi:hypothetical protein
MHRLDIHAGYTFFTLHSCNAWLNLSGKTLSGADDRHDAVCPDKGLEVASKPHLPA